MALINLQLYDNYANEPFNMRHGKPRGMLRCGFCDEYWEPDYNEHVECNVCKNCGEVCMPYEEE